MNTLYKSKLFATGLGFWMALAPMQASAEDIDIFTGASAGTAASPNVLIILDNSANWSREAQKWQPTGTVQGQAEVNAINTVINSLGAAGTNVNIGLMEYGSSFAGYTRFAVKQMTGANIASFGTQLNTMYNNINDPSEKLPMNNWYGDLMYDAYNYFSGAAPVTPGIAGVSINPDPDGYTSTDYTQFASPIEAANSCARNFIIFIGNPAQGGPRPDTAANSCALAALNGTTCPGGKFSPQLGLPNFTSTTETSQATLGTTSQCYSAAEVSTKNSAISACLTAGESNCYATHVGPSYLKNDGANGNSATDCASYTNNCSIGTTALPNICPTGQLRYSVVQTVTGGSTVTSTAPTTSCYASPEVTGTDFGTLTCPAGATCTYSTGAVASACTAPSVTSTASTTGCYSSAAAVDPADHGSLTCPADHTCTYTTGASTSTCTSGTTTVLTTSCYSGLNTGGNKWSNSTDHGSLTCPDGASCSYSATETGQVSCGTNPASYRLYVTQSVVLKKYSIKQTATPASTGYRYTITQTAVTTSETTTNLGYTAACHASPPASTSDFASSCSGAGTSCTYGNSPTTDILGGSCASGNKYPVIGTDVVTTNTPTGTTTVDTNTYNADEWARLLYQKGVPVSGSSNAKISTYTIDVHKAQPDAPTTSLYLNMAKFGGGKYFKAGSEQEIADALTKILAEIQSVNSTFASASLPVNSTNRAQNANQVFIGMFRPDPNANPRWFGNMKQYQIGSDGASLDLYDNATPSKPAINILTGFLDDCAQSFWTTDSPTTATASLPWIASHYWGNIASEAPVGNCTTTAYNIFSDIPDGAFVEKGAVAEILRKGNDPATTNTNPTWSFNRDMYTLSSGTLAAYSSANSGLSTATFNFTQGKDVNNDSSLTNWTSSTNVMRHSVHGDVIHSRPLPVNYGTTANPNAGVTVYYGSNDGTYRAVVATGSNAGKELWAFVAPEFSSIAASRNTTASTDPLTRLKNNSPAVNYPVEIPVAGAIPKDYFFDGSTGIYQNADNTKVWIYPAMRRGGRMIYAFDVTNSGPFSTATPKFAFKWRAGCPNLTNDTGCADGTGDDAAEMAGIGQTWSTPAPAFIHGFSTTTPAVIMGGGYDACEDADTAAPSCDSSKGRAVYVLNGNTGNLIKKFNTLRSVVADIAFIDPNNDGYVDYGYVADTGGNIYRINFLDPATNAYLDDEHWTIRRIAYTSGGGRKFQWMPGLLPSGGKVYVTIASGDREHPLETHYPSATVTNRLYVYLDDPSDTASAATDLDGTDMSDFTENTACTTPGIVPGSSNTDKGWFMSFTGTGEQAVTSAVIAGGMVTVSTNLPIPSTAGTCSTALGEARGYWVNLFNASGAMGVSGTCGSADRFGTFAGGGLPPSPVFGTVPIDGKPTTVLIGAIQRSGEASSPIAPQLLRPVIQHIRKPRYWKNSGDN